MTWSASLPAQVAAEFRDAGRRARGVPARVVEVVVVGPRVEVVVRERRRIVNLAREEERR